MTLVVLAVDDERPALDELVYLLREQEQVARVLAVADATAALRTLSTEPVDAVFLDINMPGLNGMELAGVLAGFANPPAVVFVTAHDDRALAAYDVGAVDYLLKPLRAARLSEAVRRIVATRSAPAAGVGENVVPVELGGVTTLVPRASIGWVEAEGDYSRLHAAGGAHLVRIPISSLESRWAEVGFQRVHRSYLVSLGFVTGTRSVGTGMVVRVRANGSEPAVELPVSRRHARALRQRWLSPLDRGER